MKTIQLANGDELMLVEIPKDATDIEIDLNHEGNESSLWYRRNKQHEMISSYRTKLGRYLNESVELLGAFDSSTGSIDFEERLKQDWCDSRLKIDNYYYRDYQQEEDVSALGASKYRLRLYDSFLSLLSSLNLSGRFACLLIKK